MRANDQNKENFDPKTPIAAPAMQADTTEMADGENMDGFVEIILTSDNSQIDKARDLTSSSSTTKEIDENSKGADGKIGHEEAEMDEDGMEGLESMESSTTLGDLDLDEFLEIEKEIPDDLETPEPPARPYTPFENHTSNIQGSAVSQVYPPSHDSEDLPTPLKAHKSSYFSKDNPMLFDSEFEEDNEEGDYWFEESEAEDDGIRRDEVDLSFAEWQLNKHPVLGKYRVKDISRLRVCETIQTEDRSQDT